MTKFSLTFYRGYCVSFTRMHLKCTNIPSSWKIRNDYLYVEFTKSTFFQKYKQSNSDESNIASIFTDMIARLCHCLHDNKCRQKISR